MLGSRPPPSRAARYFRVNCAVFARGELTWLTDGFSLVQQQHHGVFFCLQFFSLPRITTKYNNLILILKILDLIHLFMFPFPGCLWAVIQSRHHRCVSVWRSWLIWMECRRWNEVHRDVHFLFNLRGWIVNTSPFSIFFPQFISKAFLMCLYVALLFRRLGRSLNNTFVRVLMQEKYRKEHFQNCL